MTPPSQVVSPSVALQICTISWSGTPISCSRLPERRTITSLGPGSAVMWRSPRGVPLLKVIIPYYMAFLGSYSLYGITWKLLLIYDISWQLFLYGMTWQLFLICPFLSIILIWHYLAVIPYMSFLGNYSVYIAFLVNYSLYGMTWRLLLICPRRNVLVM